MLDDAPEILKEIVVGLAWPIHGPMSWLAKPWGGFGSREWIRAVELAAVVIAVVAFFIDLADRKDERLARMWHWATDDRPGNTGKIPALEFLNKEQQPLEGIAIPAAYLVEADLAGANLKKAELEEADLRSVNLSDAVLNNANLSRSNLRGANLSNAEAETAKFSAADLRKANLSNADLYQADFSGANIRAANLRRAKLDNANFSGANLLYANLTEAFFDGANLSGADLSWAHLRGAISLTQEQLDTACGTPPKNLPEGLVWTGAPCPK